ncbi:hypothetical protein KIH86_01390, partial [Paenibacillus sp. HN-1]
HRTHSHAVLVPISIVVLVFELNLMTLRPRAVICCEYAIRMYKFRADEPCSLRIHVRFALIILQRNPEYAMMNKMIFVPAALHGA